MLNNKTRLLRLIIIIGIGLFIIFPILWIIIISVQAGTINQIIRYEIIPTKISFFAYREAIIKNERGIMDSMIYSFGLCSLSTISSMLVAISSIYLIKAEIILKKRKRQIFSFSIGLFFLPVFLIYPALQFLSQQMNILGSVRLQLILIYTLQGYAISFILLMIFYTSSKNTYFEQLLLETESRMRAFYYGVIEPKMNETIIVAGITFTTIWSEFFLSGLITSSQKVKPFSVILQMAHGQYSTEFSTFAVGAVLSLIASSIFFLVMYFLGRFIKKWIK